MNVNQKIFLEVVGRCKAGATPMWSSDEKAIIWASEEIEQLQERMRTADEEISQLRFELNAIGDPLAAAKEWMGKNEVPMLLRLLGDELQNARQKIKVSQKQEPFAWFVDVAGVGFNTNKPYSEFAADFPEKVTALYASPVVTPAQQEPIKSLEFLFRHKSSGQEVTVEITRDQIIEDMDYRIRDGLSEVVCQCESIGETNVVECNCEDYEEGFELVEQPRSEDKPS